MLRYSTTLAVAHQPKASSHILQSNQQKYCACKYNDLEKLGGSKRQIRQIRQTRQTRQIPTIFQYSWKCRV